MKPPENKQKSYRNIKLCNYFMMKILKRTFYENAGYLFVYQLTEKLHPNI